MPGARTPNKRAAREIWRRSARKAWAAPGYWTLTATCVPSLHTALCTWPMDAAAAGSSLNSWNWLRQSGPDSPGMTESTMRGVIGGAASCSLVSVSRYGPMSSSGSVDSKMLIAWPNFMAPPMTPRMVDSVMSEEFGPDWRSQFQEFNELPAAAASIGQVHKAVWSDGTQVAVKVQYPGAAQALRADLRQISRAARLFGVLAPGIDVKALVEELRERVAEELDYSLEAGAQSLFAGEFEGDPRIEVPRVIAHTKRALVTAWLDSESSLAQIIADGTQEQRDHFGEIYVRFLFDGPARTGMLHADPHPGNFRIMPDGRIGVVDFGSVARLPEGLPPIIGELLRYAVDDD